MATRNKSKKSSKNRYGNPAKRAQEQLASWMRYYDAEFEDDPFWHGATTVEVPKLPKDPLTLAMVFKELMEGVHEAVGPAPEGKTLRTAVILDHPFRRDASILRFKLDVKRPESAQSDRWTSAAEGFSFAPSGTIRSEFDKLRAS